MFRTDITPQIIGAAIKVHRQKAVPLVYRSVKLECGFRADLVVEGRVVVEIKGKEALHPVDVAQILSHLRLLDIYKSVS